MAEYIFIFLFAVSLGSFYNVLIRRLPLSVSIVSSSSCPTCQKKIPWYENIPLISFVLLRARCSHCKAKISLQYPIVELLSAIIALILYSQMNLNIHFILHYIIFSLLLILSFIDIKYKAVPDYLLLLTLGICFVYYFKNFEVALLFAGAFTLLNFIITFYIQNIKSRFSNDKNLKEQEALGEGDIPIIACIGAILGVQSGLAALFLSACFALIPALLAHFLHKQAQTPFIPFLSLGLFVEFSFHISKVVL